MLTDCDTWLLTHVSFRNFVNELFCTMPADCDTLFVICLCRYFEREDDSIRSACAYTIQSIGNHNQEILKSHADVVLPLVFFAMHAEKTPGK